MGNEKIMEKTAYDFSKANERMQTIFIALIALMVPTFLAQLINIVFGSTSIVTMHSQIIVGSIVNTVLIISAINLKGWKKIAYIITMPSVSTLLGGFVFKSASIYLVYMIPAIWFGNFALVYAYKLLTLGKNKHFLLSGVIGIVVKVVVIFTGFSILNGIGVFPAKVGIMLQTAMGVTQLITATIGTILSFGIYKLETKK